MNQMVILSVIVIVTFSSLLLSLILVSSSPLAVEARCINGYHISPDGDCEIVTNMGGLPRCPDGYHRSPSGDCEQVSSGEADVANGPSLKSQDDNHEESISETTDDNRLSSSEISLIQSSECRGEADCFRGTVTEIVDGDTIDVNNVRIRLSMVNTPERGENGFNEATELTESIQLG